MSRKDAKKLACSRDCSCVKGKERDNNYNECVDKIYDYFDDKLKLYEIHSKLPKKLKKWNEFLILLNESGYKLVKK